MRSKKGEVKSHCFTTHLFKFKFDTIEVKNYTGENMHLDVSAEVLLSQLGYTKTENSLSQAQKMIDNTKGFEKFSKHIISLHDHIKKMNAYVGLSNKTDFFKIKCDENDAPEILEEFHQEVAHWSNKYNVALERLDQKPIYYILGTKAD